MVRRRSVALVASVLIAGLSLAIPITRSVQTSAEAIAPRAFVSELSCDVTRKVVAGFEVSGEAETRARLAELGVAGTPDAVWIDLSLFNNGFAQGTFLNTGPFAVEQNGRAKNWFGVLPNTPALLPPHCPRR